MTDPEPPTERSWAHRMMAALWLRIARYAGPIIGIGGVALAGWGEAVDDGQARLPFPPHDITGGQLRSAGAVLGGLGLIAAGRRIQKLTARAESATTLAVAAARAEAVLAHEIRQELRRCTEALNLYSTGRASLFLQQENGFLLVGRYSAMPRYSRCSGRDKYPEHFGVLGEAWDRVNAESLNLPAPGDDIAPNKGWVREQRRMGVPDEDIETMTMRSRSYAGVRLDSAARCLGVLVVESESADGVSLEALKRQVSDHPSLARLLDHLRGLEPPRVREAVLKLLRDGGS